MALMDKEQRNLSTRGSRPGSTTNKSYFCSSDLIWCTFRRGLSLEYRTFCEIDSVPHYFIISGLIYYHGHQEQPQDTLVIDDLISKVLP